MPETPRSSKRRRLDPSSATPSKRRSSRKSLVPDDIDPYDDFDGALGEGPHFGKGDRSRVEAGQKSTAKRKSGRFTAGSKEEPTTPRKNLFPSSSGRQSIGRQRVEESAVENAIVNGDAGSEDELGDDEDNEIVMDADMQLRTEAKSAVTPSKRRKRTGRKTIDIEPVDEPEDVAMEDTHIGVDEDVDVRESLSRTESIEGTEVPHEIPKPTPRRGRPPKRKRKHRLDELDDNIVNASQPHPTAEIDAHTITPEPSEDLSLEFSTLRFIVLSKLANRRPIPLTNLSAEYSKVHTLLSATVQTGESNSMLLIGARGSGKSTLINKALKDLSQSSKENFHTVRLNGFIQTDDKLALREIWRQLGREMEIDSEESGPGKSYADTLTMLLALLSHPDEIAGEAVDQVAKSVIFIMDEFDLFATHPRQTLLYNLLDIAQSRKAPIAVLGLTTRIDVTEALEKRVKSRFSHRYVHVGLPKGLGQFVELGKVACMITPEELNFEEKNILSVSAGTKEESVDWLKEWNDAVEVSFFLFIFCATWALSINDQCNAGRHNCGRPYSVLHLLVSMITD